MSLRTIVLLTGAAEYPFLAEWLRTESSHHQTLHVATLGELDRLASPLLAEARLIAFCTGIIVPARVLGSLGHGAYNFHPGPPNYPGSAPAAFAIYDKSPTFGGTAHEMRERVDCGPIIACDIFPMPPEIGLRELEELTYAVLAKLFRTCAPLLVRPEPAPHLPTAWSGKKSSRRDYAALCEIPESATEAEIARRLRALGPGDGKSAPTIALHGRRFRLAETD